MNKNILIGIIAMIMLVGTVFASEALIHWDASSRSACRCGNGVQLAQGWVNESSGTLNGINWTFDQSNGHGTTIAIYLVKENSTGGVNNTEHLTTTGNFIPVGAKGYQPFITPYDFKANTRYYILFNSSEVSQYQCWDAGGSDYKGTDYHEWMTDGGNWLSYNTVDVRMGLNLTLSDSSDYLNLSNPTPIVNSSFNIQPINFSTYVNSSYNFNCSLYINRTKNRTYLDYTAGQNVFVSFNESGFQEQYYNYSISCTSWGDIINTTTYSFLYDISNPIIEVSPSLETNNSFTYGNDGGNLIASINGSDTHLYSMNITIDDSIIVFNKTNLGTTKYNYNLSLNPSDYSLTLGVHTLSVEIADDHTKNVIPNYKYTKNSITKSLTYDFNKGWIKIDPSNNEFFSAFDTWKKTDRYVFNYKKSGLQKFLNKNDFEFIVSSSDEITIIENSNYRGHMVIAGLAKWIDFENEDESVGVTLERINKNEVKVIISNFNADEITFNSLGGLNVVKQSFEFYYGNVTQTYTNRSLEYNTLTYAINFTKNNSFVNGVDLKLHHNGTEYSPTISAENEYYYATQDIFIGANPNANLENISFWWNWNLTNNNGVINITNRTDEINQSIYSMVVSNCTGSTNATYIAINFTPEDEIDSSRVTNDFSALVDVWNYSSNYKKTYAFEMDATDYPQICVYPSWATLNTNIETEFLATGYDLREWIVNDYEVSANHTNITIYMTSSGNTTAVEFTLVDGSNNELEGYTLVAERYILATDSYLQIDTKTTNAEGKALFNLDVVDNEYRILVKDLDGDTIKIRSKSVLTETEYVIQVFLGTTEDVIQLNLNDLEYNLSIDQNLNNFSLSWDDSDLDLISAINLTIYERNVTDLPGGRPIYSSVSTSTTGTMSYNISSTDYGHFDGVMYVTSTDDGNVYVIDSVSLDLREEWGIFGTVETILLVFLFVGTMIMIGIALNPAMGILLGMAGLFLFSLLGFIKAPISALIGLAIAGVIIMVKVMRR